MPRIPLRSKKGCHRCRERRRKCDERKPACGECLRLRVSCRWDGGRPRQAEMLSLVQRSTRIEELPDVKAQRLVQHLGQVSQAFDHPNALRASPTSIVGSTAGKHVLKYLFEDGHRILRYPAERLPVTAKMNNFSIGYPMAVSAPVPIHVQALLCVGAAFLSRKFPKYETLSLEYYHSTMSAFRSVLQHLAKDSLPEWACAVAALLSYYQMFVFHSSNSRIAHLLGFHRLVETRIEMGLPWSRGRFMPEHYIHSLSINGLFHFDTFMSDKSIGHIDYLIAVLNSEVRLLGKEIVAVPADLTAAVYKLSFLNNNDTTTSPWTFELCAVTTVVMTWQPDVNTSVSSANTLTLIGQLYHLACCCLVQHIWYRDHGVSKSGIEGNVDLASMIVGSSDLAVQPINSMGWPLTVLGIFAAEKHDRETLRRPLQSLTDVAQLTGYRSILSFLDLIWSQNLGSTVLQRPEILAMVHM